MLIHSAACLFHQPVDYHLPGCNEYYQIIDHPTDLQTMIARNNRGEYTSVLAFEEEFTRMIQNCLFYNYVCEENERSPFFECIVIIDYHHYRH